MKQIRDDELQLISGGDRWGDGQDQKNHSDSNIIGEICTPVDNPANGSGWEICVIARTRQ